MPTDVNITNEVIKTIDQYANVINTASGGQFAVIKSITFGDILTGSLLIIVSILLVFNLIYSGIRH